MHDVLETSQSREPTVPEPLGAPAVGREAGITWERGKGPRDRFGEGEMCYCEEGVCLPWRKEEGNAGLAPEGRCMAEFIGGKEAGTEASPEHWAAPSELTGSHGKRPRAAKQLRKACQDMAALGEGGAAPCQPPTAALGSHTMPCTAPHRHSPVGSPGGACSQAGLEGSECLCAPEDTAKGAVGLLWLFPEGTRT